MLTVTSPGAFGSDPAGRFGGVDTVSRGTTARVGGAGRWVQPWFGAASPMLQVGPGRSRLMYIATVQKSGTSESSLTADRERVEQIAYHLLVSLRGPCIEPAGIRNRELVLNT